MSKIFTLGLCPIHFTVTSAWTKSIHRYTGRGKIVISRIVISGFRCTSMSIIFSDLNKLCRSKATGLNNIPFK